MIQIPSLPDIWLQRCLLFLEASKPGVLKYFGSYVPQEICRWGPKCHQGTYFLSFSFFWTLFKCHKEWCEVPHVALVPLFEEACSKQYIQIVTSFKLNNSKLVSSTSNSFPLIMLHMQTGGTEKLYFQFPFIYDHIIKHYVLPSTGIWNQKYSETMNVLWE